MPILRHLLNQPIQAVESKNLTPRMGSCISRDEYDFALKEHSAAVSPAHLSKPVQVTSTLISAGLYFHRNDKFLTPFMSY